jgi:hypothetical protein
MCLKFSVSKNGNKHEAGQNTRNNNTYQANDGNAVP